METIKQNIVFSLQRNGIDVFEELLLGPQSEWWPEKMMMRFINLSGDIKEGTLYWQKARFPLGPAWHKRNEVVDREKKYLRRTFLDGMFKGGYEEFFVHQDRAQIEVVYRFCCELKGRCSRMLWNMVYKRLHCMNIERVLGAFRKYCEAGQ
ncbi:MAG: hypothetical protein JXD21_01875 [Candidatus Omnitrophica bacterium]|nr:hypothetical protein [Candidatus Omnitrophota bacterium]